MNEETNLRQQRNGDYGREVLVMVPDSDAKTGNEQAKSGTQVGTDTNTRIAMSVEASWIAEKAKTCTIHHEKSAA